MTVPLPSDLSLLRKVKHQQKVALLHIHYKTDIAIDKIVRRFVKLHPRRMELSNITSD